MLKPESIQRKTCSIYFDIPTNRLPFTIYFNPIQTGFHTQFFIELKLIQFIRSVQNFPLVLYRRLDIFPTHKLRSPKLRDSRQIETINLSRLYAAPRTDIFYILMKRPHTTLTRYCVDKIKAFCLFFIGMPGAQIQNMLSPLKYI